MDMCEWLCMYTYVCMNSYVCIAMYNQIYMYSYYIIVYLLLFTRGHPYLTSLFLFSSVHTAKKVKLILLSVSFSHALHFIVTLTS